MRLKTSTVKIGKIKIGHKHPIAIQSMTDTDTADALKTAEQCIKLADAGAELVRITIDNEKSAESTPQIRKILDEKGYKNLPLIGDFHFNGHELLEKFPLMAKTLDKYRINPGNIGYGKNRDKNFERIIKIAIKNSKPVRIGGNWGSLDQEMLKKLLTKNTSAKNPKNEKDLVLETLIKSTLQSAQTAEKLGLSKNKIVLSVKTSGVNETIQAYEMLTKEMGKNPYCLHLGLTEAGSGTKGIVSSAAALSTLLHKGIGDTIRISLTPKPKEPRTKEVKVAKTLLESLDLREFSPKITSCPGCGRTKGDYYRKLAKEIEDYLKNNHKKLSKKYPKFKKLKIAIMGCIVNGPGEARYSDISLSLPGKKEKPVALVYKKGKLIKTISRKSIAVEFIKILEAYLKSSA